MNTLIEAIIAIPKAALDLIDHFLVNFLSCLA